MHNTQYYFSLKAQDICNLILLATHIMSYKRLNLVVKTVKTELWYSWPGMVPSIHKKMVKWVKIVLSRLKITCFSTFLVGQDQNSWSKCSDPPYLHRPRAIPACVPWRPPSIFYNLLHCLYVLCVYVIHICMVLPMQ